MTVGSRTRNNAKTLTVPLSLLECASRHINLGLFEKLGNVPINWLVSKHSIISAGLCSKDGTAAKRDNAGAGVAM